LAITIGNAKISSAHRGLRFKVEKRDIENGQPNDPCACAAARALRRTFNLKEVFVFRDVTYMLRKDGTAMRYHTSPALRLETVVFDRQGQFYPGEYDLGPMPLREAVKKVSKSSATKRGRNSRGGYRAIPNVRPTASQRLPRV